MEEECNKHLYVTMARTFASRIVVTLFLVHVFVLGIRVAFAGQSPVIAVIYPELEDPYRTVLSSIIEGIREQSKAVVKLNPVSDRSDIPHVAESIDKEQASAIIALGKTGFTAAERWRGKLPIVVGALLLTPDKSERGVAGISLAADPELVLAHLVRLAPSVKRVHVVYSPDRSEWLVQIAQNSAKKFGLQLFAYKSNDIKNSALIYRDILSKARPEEDAIWLLPDPVAVDSKIILPLLLRETWNNSLFLISSSPTYVKRGALFALFPDNRSMGRSLEKMAETYLGDDAVDMNNTVLPLKDLQAAINVRTAEHLGLALTGAQRKDYALIFPAP
jgi:putative ABC transport system substrate-binding protein